MWVVGYDPADTNDLRAGGLEHWLRRHGSPFHPDSESYITAHWIPITAIPALENCATASDFILISVPEIPSPADQQIWTDDNPPPQQIREIMNEISHERALISIEFTYHADFGSNTIERIQNLIQPALLGIPSFITMPMSVIQNRGTGRLGNGTQTQVYFENMTTNICRDLVANNQPVTYENVSDLLPEGIVLPRDLEGGGQANNDFSAKTTFATWKVPLMTGVIRDTWAPCFRIPMPQTTVNFPDLWRMSGCQLQNIYDLISESIDTYLDNGGRLNAADACIEVLRNENENALININPPTARRNANWDTYCSLQGFPRQSRANMDAAPAFLTGNVEHVQSNHHTLLSPSLSTICNISTIEGWQNWVNQARNERACNGNSLVFSPNKLRQLRFRNYNEINLELLPAEIGARDIIATIHIKDYTANIAANPMHHPMRERSYLGRTLMMDLINFRENADDDDLPRAVVPNRRARRVILAADLPISSETFEDSLNDSSIAEWYRLADIFVLEDGIFLGREWTGGELLRLA